MKETFKTSRDQNGVFMETNERAGIRLLVVVREYAKLKSEHMVRENEAVTRYVCFNLDVAAL